MVTTGWCTQIVAAPVIDHIVSVTVLNRQAIAALEFVTRACAALFELLIVIGPAPVLAAIRLAALIIAPILLIPALRLFMAIPITLAEGNASRGQ
jgi:hypothetical protein